MPHLESKVKKLQFGYLKNNSLKYEKIKKSSIGTRQNIVIDAREQGITYSQEQKIIQKIIDKSNGTIKNSDITIWK